MMADKLQRQQKQQQHQGEKRGRHTTIIQKGLPLPVHSCPLFNCWHKARTALSGRGDSRVRLSKSQHPRNRATAGSCTPAGLRSCLHLPLPPPHCCTRPT